MTPDTKTAETRTSATKTLDAAAQLDREETHALGSKAQRTRRKILQGAREELIERDGLLEVASVAARSEVSPGLIYRYFNSRIALIAAVIEDFYDQYDQWVMDLNPKPGASWLERESERVLRCLHFLDREPLSAMVFMNKQKDPEVAEVENRRLNAHLALAVENVKQAQIKGEIPGSIDPNIACAMTMGGLREVMVQLLAVEGSSVFSNRSKKQLAEQIMEFIAGAMGLKKTNNNDTED